MCAFGYARQGPHSSSSSSCSYILCTFTHTQNCRTIIKDYTIPESLTTGRRTLRVSPCFQHFFIRRWVRRRSERTRLFT